MIKFVDLKAQYNSIKEDINKALQQVLDSSQFVLGGQVKNFENEFADFCNAKYAVGVNSGTSALHLALLAKGIGKNDEVITTPNTFIATCAAISYTGATPRLVDIEPDTYNMDPKKLESAITQKTKAVIPVHLYGQPAEMNEIIKIAQKHNLEIIEDACQAHGAEHHGKKVPVSGTACFSFYPGKNLGAYGEGGMIVSNDKKFDEKLRAYRDHGQTKKNVHKYIGYNYRLEEIQAAVLRVKLRHLAKWTEMRRKNALLYNEMLKGCDIATPVEKKYNKHVYHLYVIRAKNRQKLAEYLNLKEIQTGVHYPTPIHLQEAYSNLGYKKGSFPIAEQYADEILSLPMFPELTEEQISYVSKSIKDFLKC
ncbi:DegT/DnrJ/EryC1/StrS family aminotransferase [Candidatus Woesearchaeota archaeon]|nr:DegT/DnrJ/EryC1/StrS family aminotransferase [Candidatus Woesearchaeota archaeon]